VILPADRQAFITHLPPLSSPPLPNSATGWQDADFHKPIITIGAPWTNANPCNNRVRELADILVEEVEKAGGKAFVAGTPVISDG